jgi:Ca-activated chloride channel family protein
MLCRWLPLGLLLMATAPVFGQGLLVPTDTTVPPLHLIKHDVAVEIEDQVATTKVTQVYHNDSGRDLEATYVFPVPKGANVNKFSMWINGTETKAELVEADKARQIYTDIVRRAQDPGLLEYVGNNLLKVRVYPVPARGDQKLAFSYTAVVDQDNGLCEYVYPLRTSEKAGSIKTPFLFQAKLKSQGILTNVYCPTHKIVPTQPNDHESSFTVEQNQSALDKDLTIYYGISGKDVGLSAVPFRADADSDGHVMLLISPRATLSKSQNRSA